MKTVRDLNNALQGCDADLPVKIVNAAGYFHSITSVDVIDDTVMIRASESDDNDGDDTGH